MPRQSDSEKPAQLERYRQKRDFTKTPEPPPTPAASGGEKPIFVVQMHQARRLHWDFRLEIDGVLKSWAVPKGPSANPQDKRLAVMTEDHPLEYAGFEGTIPAGEYGAGSVLLWDLGTFRNDGPRHGLDLTLEEQVEKGHILVWLEGKKLKGGYALIHTRMGGDPDNWLLIKESKDHEMDPTEDIVKTRPESVLTGRTIDQISASPDP